MFSRPRHARSREQAVLRNTTRAKIIAHESQGSPLLTPFNAKPLNDIIHSSIYYSVTLLLYTHLYSTVSLYCYTLIYIVQCHSTVIHSSIYYSVTLLLYTHLLYYSVTLLLYTHLYIGIQTRLLKVVYNLRRLRLLNLA